MKDVTLNQKELAGLSVLNSVLEYQVPIADAAELLGVSPRHARRMLAAYRERGAAALAHGNRGRRPHNATSPGEAAAVVQLATERYEGANHTHLTELLSEREGIGLSRPTVRRILTRAGIGSPRSRRSPQHRFRRQRMPQAGMLIQQDGSHHAWLEDRGPKFALLLAVDDATSTVINGVFCVSETTAGYFTLLEGLIEDWGIPLALHSDRHAVFKHNARQPGDRGRSHPVHPVPAGTGHPADLRRLSPSDRPGRACGWNLPGPAGNRTAPGRCQDHRPGHGGAAGLPAPLQRPLRGAAGASGARLPLDGSRSVPAGQSCASRTPARWLATTR